MIYNTKKHARHCWTRWLLTCNAVCWLLLAPFSTVLAAGFSLANTVWETAAAEEQHDPLLLYAVALAESARARKPGSIAPWPWTLNDRGKGHYFSSRAEAAAYLDKALLTSSNIDVGIMQINLRWNGHRATTPHALLETRTNIQVAARILREAIDSIPKDPELGVGRYHSSDPVRARAYGRKVMAIYQNLAMLVAFPQ